MSKSGWGRGPEETMSGAIPIEISDNGELDAFGALRVSTPETLFDSKLRYGKNSTLWDEEIVGTATSTHDINNSLVDMTVNASGDAVIRQTRTRHKYQAGKSQRIEMTAVLPIDVGVESQIGYFQVDQSSPHAPIDGIYFECVDGVVSCCIANAGAASFEKATQSEWNIDKLDGTGRSGKSLDISKGQIFFIDLQWLSLGRVRYGFLLSGKLYYCHEFQHENALTAPYMRSGSQPLCYRIKANALVTATLKSICTAVSSEGGSDKTGIVAALSRKVATVVVGTAAPVAIFGIRMKSTEADAIIENIKVNLLTTTNDAVRWFLAWNPPAVAGTITWTPVTGGSLEQFIGDATNTVTEGLNIDEGFFSTQERSESAASVGNIKLGVNVDGTPDVIYLCVQGVTGNATVTGGLVVRQLV